MQADSGQHKARIIFVDDEQRVLNSMRVMFRREFELHLTTSGSEALRILKEHAIDVIVADQRMPEMQGTEVLAEARNLSPRTLRILLTGYADLDAIEASINQGEVFRFLTKPCAPEELKETLRQAVAISRDSVAIEALEAALPGAEPDDEYETFHPQLTRRQDDAADVDAQPSVQAAEAAEVRAADQLTAALDIAADIPSPGVEVASREESVSLAVVDFALMDESEAPSQAEHFMPRAVGHESSSDDDPEAITIVLEGDSALEVAGLDEDGDAQPDSRRRDEGVGVLVFTERSGTLAEIREMLNDRYMVVGATNIVSVTKLLKGARPGVLVTDISEDLEVIETMVNAMKEHLPELVTIVVGEHRDTVGLVNLINYGQIYRFLQKPLAAGTFNMAVKAAVHKHLQLRKYPELARRYAVRKKPEDEIKVGPMRGFLDRLRGVKRLWAAHG